jgi:hypothetical protein
MTLLPEPAGLHPRHLRVHDPLRLPRHGAHLPDPQQDPAGHAGAQPDPRSTDDKFVMEIRTEDNHDHSADAIVGMLREGPVFEINERQC